MLKKKDFKNILIYGHSNIGDICYDIIVVHPLRKLFPQAKFSFVTAPKAEQLIRAVAGIDEVIVFDKHGKDKGLWGNIRFIQDIRRRKFDLGVILRGQMSYLFNIPQLIVAGNNFSFRYYKHVVYSYLELLRNLGVSDPEIKFEFNFSLEEKDFTAKMMDLRPGIKVGIMPFSAWKLKCWSIEKWNALIEYLIQERGAEVFIFGKTGESGWEREYVKKFHPQAKSLVDKLSLTGTLSMIQELDLFIGSDTSWVHFSSCFQVPTIVLLGPTHIDTLYPFFHRDLAITAENKVACQPCSKKFQIGTCKSEIIPAKCMDAITVDEVVAGVAKALSGKPQK